jgi:hypothetical protein
MKPPKVYDETIPNSHRIINRTKIVQSIERLQIPHRLPSNQCMSVGAALPLSVFVLSFPVDDKSARSGPKVKWDRFPSETSMACASEPVAARRVLKRQISRINADLIRRNPRRGVVFGFESVPICRWMPCR